MSNKLIVLQLLIGNRHHSLFTAQSQKDTFYALTHNKTMQCSFTCSSLLPQTPQSLADPHTKRNSCSLEQQILTSAKHQRKQTINDMCHHEAKGIFSKFQHKHIYLSVAFGKKAVLQQLGTTLQMNSILTTPVDWSFHFTPVPPT